MKTIKNFVDSNDVDMSILVVSYDGYSDLWEDFFTLFNANWGERKYPLYLANNTLKVDFKNVHIINCGEKAKWSTRVRTALNHINTKYICLLVEDYFVTEEVHQNEIDSILNFIKSERIKYYKFKMDKFSTVKGNIYKNYKFLHAISDNMEYGISLQPAIWDKKYLMDLIGTENYSVWKFEIDQIDKLGGTNSIIDKHVFDERNVMKICHVVVQGKILPSAINHLNKRGYKMKTSFRKKMSAMSYLIYRFKQLFKHMISYRQRKVLKNILSKIGVKFVSLEKK